MAAFLALYLKFLEEELPRSQGSVLPGVRQLLEKFAPGSWSRENLAAQKPDFIFDDLGNVDDAIATLGW